MLMLVLMLVLMFVLMFALMFVLMLVLMLQLLRDLSRNGGSPLHRFGRTESSGHVKLQIELATRCEHQFAANTLSD